MSKPLTSKGVEAGDVLFGENYYSGVHVESAFPSILKRKAHPIIFVHGGCHGSWAFENYQPFFARHGWENHALNWFNHNGSRCIPTAQFITRGLSDIKAEISLVASTLELPPIIIAHSMGSMAAQKFAEENEVSALVLLAPVVSVEANVKTIELPVEAERPWGPPPFDVAKHLFFDGMEDVNAQLLYSRLCPESPRCVLEATRFTVSVKYNSIDWPILVFGAEYDSLVPASYVKALADLSGAQFHFVSGRGHNLLFEPGWKEMAIAILEWLLQNPNRG